ncbi:hypothetical protein N0V93_008533 [Gnomoniopsis smithogilvyi]|uniref:Alcohol dehydrogenase iron-type/glycerol dehydrogenase GldA domain-containing protein n=1 Tax=Gnomoniopsis smithogilvyi TaxID=1191159 RepID=A0A9W9CTT1_9PEZI|nr:hypothetical protein N0V93_008533 [Gnomoniopsis smithogilvyi]
MAHETIERFDPSEDFPIITYGLPYPEALARQLSNTLHCSRPFMIVSKSLAKETDALERLNSSLNNGDAKVAGIHVGMRPHTYYSEVLEVAGEAKSSGADCVVTIGGGSLTDAAKAIVLMLANEVSTLDEMDDLFKKSNAYRSNDVLPAGETLPTIHPPKLPIICIPTTLSAGEYNPPGGATHDETKHKQLFFPPNHRGPQILIMDPALTQTTPQRVWLSTGLRAMDHCVETICSSNPKAEGTEASLRGIGLLMPGLLKTKRNPHDSRARLSCQLGAAESMKANVIYGVHVGGSHGIGHQLGPIGVPHAETTCVCLPAVQKFNAKVNASQQAIVLDAFWGQPDISTVLTKRGLVKGEADLGDALDAVIRELGLPRTLKDYGIGRDQLEGIAESSLRDVCCEWNVIPLKKKEQVLEILEMCLGDE